MWLKTKRVTLEEEGTNGHIRRRGGLRGTRATLRRPFPGVPSSCLEVREGGEGRASGGKALASDGPGGLLLERSRGERDGVPSYHRLVPDDGHPLLDPVDALGDQGEVIFAHRLLGSAVGTVATACDLQVSTGRDTKQGAGFRPEFSLKGKSQLQTPNAGFNLKPQRDSRERIWGARREHQ